MVALATYVSTASTVGTFAVLPVSAEMSDETPAVWAKYDCRHARIGGASHDSYSR